MKGGLSVERGLSAIARCIKSASRYSVFKFALAGCGLRLLYT